MEGQQAAAEAKVPTAAEIDAMVAEAQTNGFSAAVEIVELCAIAGQPAMVAGFIKERKTVAQVRESLLAARVAAEAGTELKTQVTPGIDADANQATQGKPKPWGEVMSALGFKKKEGK